MGAASIRRAKKKAKNERRRMRGAKQQDKYLPTFPAVKESRKTPGMGIDHSRVRTYDGTMYPCNPGPGLALSKAQGF